MHSLQTLIKLNDDAARKVNGLLSTTRLDARIRANRDRRAEASRTRHEKIQAVIPA